MSGVIRRSAAVPRALHLACGLRPTARAARGTVAAHVGRGRVLRRLAPMARCG